MLGRPSKPRSRISRRSRAAWLAALLPAPTQAALEGIDRLPQAGWRHDGGCPARSQARTVLRSSPRSAAIRHWEPRSWSALIASKRACRAAWVGFGAARAGRRGREADGGRVRAIAPALVSFSAAWTAARSRRWRSRTRISVSPRLREADASGLRPAWPGARLGAPFGVGAGPVAGDHPDARVGLEPRRHGLGLPVGQQCYGTAALEIDHERAVGVATPPGPIIEPDGPRLAGLRTGHGAHGARAPCRRRRERRDVPRARRAADGEAEAAVHLGRPPGPAQAWGRDRTCALGEDPARAAGRVAAEAAQAQVHLGRATLPRQIAETDPALVRWRL